MAYGGGFRDVWNVPLLDLGGGYMRFCFIIKHWAGYLFCALFCTRISIGKNLNEGRKAISFNFFFFFSFKEKSWLSSMVILKAAYYRKHNTFFFIYQRNVTLFIYFPLSLSTLL